MSRTINKLASFEVVSCASCGMMFGVTVEYISRRRADGRTFFCPSGHSNHYLETENDRIRQDRDRLKQQMARYEEWLKSESEARKAAERQASARKGQITRLRNRAAAGVCPCCNRSFENLRRHMSSQHPTFKAEEVE